MTEEFLTTVVGSLPKPAWLLEQISMNADGGKQVHGRGADWMLKGAALKAAQDDATRLAVRDQERVCGLEILDQVWDYTTRSEHTWDQEWQVGDLVMWDNRCTMHRRGAFEPNEHRLLHRTQLKGDRPC